MSVERKILPELTGDIRTDLIRQFKAEVLSGKSERLTKAYKARLKQALDESGQLYSILLQIQEGTRPIQDMTKVRKLLASVTRCIHEASAYHSAS